MARLPTIPRRFVTIDQPRRLASGADIARPYQQLSLALDDIGDTLEEKQVADAQSQGQNAVTRNEQGDLEVEFRGNWSRAGRTYNRAAQQAFLARLSGDVRSAALEQRRASQNNPDSFNDSWDTYSQKILQAAPEQAQGAVTALLEAEGQRTYDGIVGQKRTADLKTFEGQIKQEITALDDELATLARNGGTDSEDYAEKLFQVRDLYQELVDNPDFTVSQEEAEIRVKRMESRHLAEAAVGMVQRTATERGIAAAEKEAKRLFWDESLNLSPSERRQYSNIALGGLRARKAADRQALRELKTESRLLRQQLGQGIGVADDVIDDTIGGLARLGGGDEALKLNRARVQARYMNEFGGLADPDQVDIAEKYFAVGNSSLVDRIAGVESGGNLNAKNPNSTATGLGQFTQGTWTQFIRARHPELLGDHQKLRSDRALSREAIAWYAEENSQRLIADGLPVNDGTLYLSHFAGPGDAIKLLKADPGASAESVMAAASIKANAFLKGKTVGWVIDWAAQKMGAAPSYVDPETVRQMRTEIASDAKDLWAGIKEGLKNDFAPSSDELSLLTRQLSLIDDQDFRQEVATDLKAFEAGHALANLPPEEAEAFLGELRAGAEDGASVDERELIDRLQFMHKRAIQGLDNDPYGYGIETNVVPAPAALDFADPGALTANLQARQQAVGAIGQRFNTGPIGVLRPQEADALARRYKLGTTDERLAIVSTMANALEPDTLKATLAQFAGKADMQNLAFAGALQQLNPEAAAGVIRGEALLAENSKLAPENTDSNRQTIDGSGSGDGLFPISLFGPGMARARNGMMGAITARYADLSFTAGDTSARLNRDRYNQSIADVSGGLLSFNGQKIIAPQYGVTQDQFDTLIDGLTDENLAGAVTAAGEPVTADQLRGGFFRDGANLLAVADGRYIVAFGNPGSQTYAVKPDGGAFVLDLREAAP